MGLMWPLSFLLMWSMMVAADLKDLSLQTEQCQRASCALPLCWFRMWLLRLRLYQITLPHVGHSVVPLRASS